MLFGCHTNQITLISPPHAKSAAVPSTVDLSQSPPWREHTAPPRHPDSPPVGARPTAYDLVLLLGRAPRLSDPQRLATPAAPGPSAAAFWQAAHGTPRTLRILLRIRPNLQNICVASCAFNRSVSRCNRAFSTAWGSALRPRTRWCRRGGTRVDLGVGHAGLVSFSALL